MAPPGRQKSKCEFCLFGGVFLRPMCRAMCRAGRFFEACRCLACWLLCPVPRRFFLQAQHVRGESFGAACPARLPCAEDTGFWLLFHAQPKEGASLFLPCSAAFSLACALPAAFVKVFTPAAWLPVLCFCVRGFFLLFFHLFLPDFFLSKFFSFVAQAATGLYFLPKRK